MAKWTVAQIPSQANQLAVVTGANSGIGWYTALALARAGREVVQLYVREQRPTLPRPDKELKAFTKVALEPGEEKVVSFRLGQRDFAVYDPRVGAWTTAGGAFDLLAGASSRDIRLRESVTLEAAHVEPARLDRLSPLRDWLAQPAALVPGSRLIDAPPARLR